MLHFNFSFQIRIRRQNIMNTVTIITAIPTALHCERGKNVTELNWCPIISHHSGNILTDTTTSFCFRNPECMVNSICKRIQLGFRARVTIVRFLIISGPTTIWYHCSLQVEESIFRDTFLHPDSHKY